MVPFSSLAMKKKARRKQEESKKKRNLGGNFFLGAKFQQSASKGRGGFEVFNFVVDVHG